jgi:putative ABC transport system permease protein
VTGTRWRKLRADLLANRSRSILAVASLAVGTLAVGAMYSASTTVEHSFRSSFLAADPPSAMLRTDPFPPALVEDVAAHPAVGEVEGRRRLEVRASSGGETRTVELVAMPDFGANRVARIEPRDGVWPPPDGAVVVERASVAELGVDRDDVLAVVPPGGPPIDLTVAGTAFDVWEVAPQLGGGPVRAYVSMATMEGLTGSGDLDSLYIRAAEDPLDRDRAVAMAASVRDDVLAPAGVAIELSAIQEPGEHRGDNALTFIVAAMQVLSLLALVIAVALVVNTVAAVLAQQRRHIGVMKAVGATSGQLTVQYLGYVLALSVGAFVVAFPLSLLAGRFLAGFLAGLANFELEPLGVPWATIGLELAVVAVLPVLAVLVAVRRAARSTVQATITDRGLTAAAPPGRFALPFGRPTRLAHRNAVRNRSRLALTVLTIAVCGSVVVGVLSTQLAMARLTDQVAGYFDHDVQVDMTEPVALAEVAAALGPDEAVASVEGWLQGQAFRIRPDGTENEGISLTGAPLGSSSLLPTLLEGRWLEPGDDRGIVINTHFADEERDLAVGDDVVLDIEGTRDAWEVVGVSSTTLVGPVAFVTADDLAAAMGEPGGTNLVAVQLEPGQDPSAASELVEASLLDAGLPVATVRTNRELRAPTDSIAGLVVALLLLVGSVLALVAVVGVAGTMTLSVIEQTREIGVLRTLGASNGSIRRLFLVQGLAIAALGAVAGVVLSVPIALLLRTAVGNSLIQTSVPGAFSWLGVGIWAVLALVIGAVGATRPARVASRLSVRETLAYE